MEDTYKIAPKKITKFRLLQLNINRKLAGVGLLEYIWGFDIFISKLPLLKTMVAANIIVWILLSIYLITKE
uniref:Uncharacterized protein n=1 Tax=viral metagenome TaxID=1070528 RepID=A0A6H1ZX84_9ZZZZ